MQQENVKKSEKLMKIVKIGKENLQFFRTCFTLSLEKTALEKPHGGQIDPSTFLGLRQGDCSIDRMNPFWQTVFICIVKIVNCSYYKAVFIEIICER